MPDPLATKADPKASVSGRTGIAQDGKGKKRARTDDDVSAAGDRPSIKVQNGRPGASERLMQR